MNIKFIPVINKLELIIEIMNRINAGEKHIVMDLPRQTGKSEIAILLNQMLILDGKKVKLIKGFDKVTNQIFDKVHNLRGLGGIAIFDDVKGVDPLKLGFSSVVEFTTLNEVLLTPNCEVCGKTKEECKCNKCTCGGGKCTCGCCG